jgi:hypothetical protein
VLKTFMLAASIGVLVCSAAAHAQSTTTPLDSLIDTTDIPKPLLATFERAYTESWVVFGSGFHQNYFFLPRTIHVTPQGTKTVWGINVQGADANGWLTSRAAIMRQRSRLGADTKPYARYLMTKIQWEIDCEGKRLRMRQLVDYDDAGKVIGASRYDDPLEKPQHDSNGDNLVRTFCEPKLRITFRDVVNTPMGQPVSAQNSPD